MEGTNLKPQTISFNWPLWSQLQKVEALRVLSVGYNVEGWDGVLASTQTASSRGEGSAGGLGECDKLNYSPLILSIPPEGGFLSNAAPSHML